MFVQKLRFRITFAYLHIETNFLEMLLFTDSKFCFKISMKIEFFFFFHSKGIFVSWEDVSPSVLSTRNWNWCKENFQKKINSSVIQRDSSVNYFKKKKVRGLIFLLKTLKKFTSLHSTRPTKKVEKIQFKN